MKKVIRFLLWLVFLTVLAIVVLLSLSKSGFLEKDPYIPTVEEETVSISKYYIYGTHLNFEMSLSKELVMEDIDNVELVLHTEFSDISYDLIQNYDNGILNLSTSDVYNEGIYLENISNDDYYLLLKITNKELDGVVDVDYYNITNTTEYGDLEYYTFTENKTNRKLNLNFEEEWVKIVGIDETMPDEYYDFTIDAGHGAIDPGAVSLDGQYTESELVYNISYLLKEELEEAGYKVRVSRPEEETLTNEFYDFYGEDGKATMANANKSKLFISLHINSSADTMYTGGVEVYSIPNIDLTTTQSFADNIVEYADTTYSPRIVDKVSDGVYIKTYSDYEIWDSNQDAIRDGYEQYDITNDTVYFFMLREPGGILTGAYVDGRNTDYYVNPYYNSNHVTESYLIELGYIVVDEDLYKLVNTPEVYVEGLYTTITEKLEREVGEIEE